MRAGRRYSKRPGQQIPTDRAHQCAEDYMIVDDIGHDYARSDGSGDIQAKKQKGDEVEEGGPTHRISRAQDPGRDIGAMEFAASCRPLRKSNAKATAISPMR